MAAESTPSVAGPAGAHPAPMPDPAAPVTPSLADNRSSDEIKADIEQTQARLAATVDALKEKLTPGAMLDEARQSVAAGAVRAVGHASAQRGPAMLFLGVLGAVLAVGFFFARRDPDDDLTRMVDEAYDDGDEFDIDWMEQYP